MDHQINENERYRVCSGEVKEGRVVEVLFSDCKQARAFAINIRNYAASIWVGYQLKRRNAIAWRLLYFKRKNSNQLIKY